MKKKRKIYGIGYREFLLWVFPDRSEEDLLSIRKSDEELIINILNGLEGEQGEVIKMRFALEGEKYHTQKQVGERINKAAQWARRLESEALRELRQPWQTKLLGMFFRTFMEEKLLELYKKMTLLEEQNAHFSKLLEEEKSKHGTCIYCCDTIDSKKQTPLFLETSMDEFKFSVRTSNGLKNAKVKTIGDLVKKTEREMLWTRNFGQKSLDELKKFLSEKGLAFREENKQ